MVTPLYLGNHQDDVHSGPNRFLSFFMTSWLVAHTETLPILSNDGTG